MARSELNHFARADEIHALPAQRAKDLLGELDGDRGDGIRRTANGRLRPHFLGDCKRPRNQRVKVALPRAHTASDGVGVFHLAQNLRLSDDHGVEARRHSEQMANGFPLPEFVEVRLEVDRIDVKVFVQKAAQIYGLPGTGGQQLDAVASRNNQPFLDAGMLRQELMRLGQAALGNREPLPNFDGRGLVVDPDKLQHHDCTNPWTALK